MVNVKNKLINSIRFLKSKIEVAFFFLISSIFIKKFNTKDILLINICISKYFFILYEKQCKIKMMMILRKVMINNGDN